MDDVRLKDRSPDPARLGALAVARGREPTGQRVMGMQPSSTAPAARPILPSTPAGAQVVTQLILDDFLNDRLNQASVSGPRHHIGSLYAQSRHHTTTNTGTRLRLEHGSGPSIEEGLKDRYQMTEEEYNHKVKPNINKKPLEKGQVTEDNMRLVEFNHEAQTGRHPSRGGLVNLGDDRLTKVQIEAIHKLALQADSDRHERFAAADHGNRAGMAHAKMETGDIFNPQMRELLKSETFAGHRLQREARERDESESTEAGKETIAKRAVLKAKTLEASETWKREKREREEQTEREMKKREELMAAKRASKRQKQEDDRDEDELKHEKAK